MVGGRLKRALRGMSCPRSGVEETVLERIRPRPEERARAERVWGLVRDRLEDLLSRRGIDAEVTLQGSLAKDTWLSGELDVDVFVLFPRDWRKRLDEVKDLLKEAFPDLPVEERYAAHPYIRVLVDGVWVDVVPALKVSSGSEAETAVDRTPFHTRYVLERLAPEQRDEVRLLKRFLKGVGVYGAEIAVRGFSGYLAELLVVAFRCFRYVLEKAASWRPPVVLDVEHHYGGNVSVLLEKFRDSPMIVVDPVDPRRNAAAAVSKRSLALFTLAARLYLRRPSLAYYWPPRPPSEPAEYLAAAGPRAWSILVAVYEFAEGVSPDVAWGQLQATARRASSLLRERGLEPIDATVAYCEEERLGYVALELLYYPPPPYRLHRGPEAWLHDRSVRFVERALELGVPGPWVADDAILYSLRPLALNARELFQRARAQKARLVEAGVLADVLLGRGVACDEAARRIYEFVLKRPLWLEGLRREGLG